MRAQGAIGRYGACGTCGYWQLVKSRNEEGYEDEGVCRRRSPIGVPSPDLMQDGRDESGVYGMTVAWPRTFAESDWCGEFKIAEDIRGKEKP